jgi:nitrite reductase/ring-hydroxylating ferredoxin subunit
MSDQGDWHRVGARSEIVPGEMFAARAGGEDILLVELDGAVHAVANICPHAYALISDGFLEGGEVECPLHAARFDIKTGKCLGGPSMDDLARFEVRVEGADVLVRISRGLT